MSPLLRATIRNRLWIIRRQRGIGRKRLARLLGHTTTSQLSRWEQGRQIPSLSHGLVLGYLFHTPVETLFEDLRNDLISQVRARQVADDEDDVEWITTTPSLPDRYLESIQ